MELIKQQPGRNDPCPCGSGLKFKKCCFNGLSPRGFKIERHEVITTLQYFDAPNVNHPTLRIELAPEIQMLLASS